LAAGSARTTQLVPPPAVSHSTVTDFAKFRGLWCPPGAKHLYIVPLFATRLYVAAGTFAVSSMPRAFMTAKVVFRVGLPFALKER
jgi:hypothetical protein